jgi:hypothetical protein
MERILNDITFLKKLINQIGDKDKFMIKKLFLLSTLVFCFSQTASAQYFQSFDFNVSNPLGVVAAMNKFMDSPSGQQSEATVYLNQYVANGYDTATHQILVVYPTADSMDADLARNATAPEWMTFLTEIQQAAQLESEGMGQILAVGGNLNSPLMLPGSGRVLVSSRMKVSDPATYASAWTDFTALNASSSDSVAYLSSVPAYGDYPGTHVAAAAYNSVGEFLTNGPQTLEGWGEFSDRVNSIREVLGVVVAQEIAVWSPQ